MIVSTNVHHSRIPKKIFPGQKAGTIHIKGNVAGNFSYGSVDLTAKKNRDGTVEVSGTRADNFLAGHFNLKVDHLPNGTTKITGNMYGGKNGYLSGVVDLTVEKNGKTKDLEPVVLEVLPLIFGLRSKARESND